MTQEIIKFLLGPFAVSIPYIAFWIALILATIVYIFRSRREIAKKITTYKFLIIFVIAFKVLYACFLVVGQYYVWASNGATQAFLNSPLSEAVPQSFVTKLFPGLFQSDLGYFYFYAYGRFFLNVFLAVGIAFAFWAFLRLLKKYNERFFEEGETELGLLAALIAGWPNFLVFIPIVFVSIVIVSIVRGVFFKEAYTTMGAPFLLATFLCLMAGDWLIKILNLSVFRV